MVVTTTKSGGKTWRYLVCEGRALKRTECTALNWRYDDFEREFIDRIGFLAVPIPADEAVSVDTQRAAELEGAISALEERHRNVLAGVAEAGDAATRSILLDSAQSISEETRRKRNELVQLRESAARFRQAAATTVDFAADLEEMQRLATEDRAEAQRLVANVVERIELESASKVLRRAVVTLRTGYAHQMVFDASGAP